MYPPPDPLKSQSLELESETSPYYSSLDEDDELPFLDNDGRSTGPIFYRQRRSRTSPRFLLWIHGLIRRLRLREPRLVTRYRRLGLDSVRHLGSTSRLRRNALIGSLLLLLSSFLILGLLAIFLTAIFNPSYTLRQQPTHYHILRERICGSNQQGRGNPYNEKVFIAANILDADLIRGPWGKSLLELIDLLGHDNVFVSIYENDSGEDTKEALRELEVSVSAKCNSSIVSEHLDHDGIQGVMVPSGERQTRRIAYLAEVRNRALRPLDVPPTSSRGVSPSGLRSLSEEVRFDKLLFVNDVVFSPLDALHLLFSTNLDPSTGRTKYRAACAVDFIDPFKFYDTFATRDLEGYAIGIPIFPWFSWAGRAESRNDVLRGTDAVRVRSCWGGMTAFEAQWFQGNVTASGDSMALGVNSHGVGWNSSADIPIPLRFRAETDMFLDSSECCLIQADLQLPYSYPPPGLEPVPFVETGIYINPFVRVAYSERTLRWLPYMNYVEKLLSIVQGPITYLSGQPTEGPDRQRMYGEEVVDKIWVYDTDLNAIDEEGNRKGHYTTVKRKAEKGGFCRIPKMLLMKNDPEDGEKKWEALLPPK